MIRSPAGFDGGDRIKRYLDYYQPSYGVMMLSAGQFSPASLFAQGEQGVWYDPSDFSTMFQDSAGTTPVTAVEQPVGLLLDKSQGLVLGPELVVNGDFSGGTTGWSGGIGAISGGQLVWSAVANNSGIYQSNAAYSGGVYEITVVVASISFGAVTVTLGIGGPTSSNCINISTAGTHVIRQGNVSGDTFLRVYSVGASTTATIDSVSVKRVNGNHATQATPASRPVLSARVNQLTYSEQFDNAAWVNRQATLTANTTDTTDPLGGNTADKLIEAGVTNFHFIERTPAFTLAAVQYTATVHLKAGTQRYGGITLYDGVSRGCMIDLQTGTLGSPIGGATASVVDVGDGWYRLTVTATCSATASGNFAVIISNSDSLVSYTGNAANHIYIWGADLRVTNVGVGLPAYQRIAAATDYDTTGFPFYLKFDGTDDSMATTTINPGAVDKMQFFAGVRKLSDASGYGVLAETAANGQGTLTVHIPFDPGTGSYNFTTGGSIRRLNTVATGYSAPITNIFTGLNDISADNSILRLNGAQVNQVTTDQGTGNYAAYPLYIGRRGGTTLPFNGNLYSLIVRFGANLDAATISNTETYVNSKTLAY